MRKTPNYLQLTCVAWTEAVVVILCLVGLLPTFSSSKSGCQLSTVNANSLQAKLAQLDCFSTVKSKERVRFPGFALSNTKSVQISVKTQKASALGIATILLLLLLPHSKLT